MLTFVNEDSKSKEIHTLLFSSYQKEKDDEKRWEKSTGESGVFLGRHLVYFFFEIVQVVCRIDHPLVLCT